MLLNDFRNNNKELLERGLIVKTEHQAVQLINTLLKEQTPRGTAPESVRISYKDCDTKDFMYAQMNGLAINENMDKIEEKMNEELITLSNSLSNILHLYQLSSVAFYQKNLTENIEYIKSSIAEWNYKNFNKEEAIKNVLNNLNNSEIEELEISNGIYDYSIQFDEESKCIYESLYLRLPAFYVLGVGFEIFEIEHRGLKRPIKKIKENLSKIVERYFTKTRKESPFL